MKKALLHKLALVIALADPLNVLAAVTNESPSRPVAALQVDARQLGAVGNGQADDTEALQKALTGGHRTVTIPPGVYKISATLKVDSHTTIKAVPQAVIRIADHAGKDVNVFLLCNRDLASGNTDITVEGGVWDGNNEHNPRGREGDPQGYTGAAINFVNVRKLAIRNLTVRNPEAFSLRLCAVEDFIIEDIRFDATVIRPNQDGVHLNGFCHRGVIRNLRALTPRTPNDDMVALNADDATDRVINLGMKCGPISDITVENLQADDAYTFVRLLSFKERIENITISNVSGGCRAYAINLDRWRFPAGGGNIRHVTLRNFNVRKVDGREYAKWSNKAPLIPIQSIVHDLRIENFRRDPADNLPAPTLVVDNGQRNRLRLEGATGEQTGNKVVLPRGGFSLLAMDPAPRGDTLPIADRIRPIAKGTGFAMDGWFVWCGSVIKVDGQYHMFASRWPVETKFPEGYRQNSQIVRAVASRPEGPYQFQEVVIGKREPDKWDSGMAHNPAIYQVGNTFVLYYNASAAGSRYRQIGIATAPAVTGPWTRRDKPLDLGFAIDANNPSALFEPDGSVRLMWRTINLLHVCVSAARSFEGPYTLANDSVWPAARLEDFFLFKNAGVFHAISEDNAGSVTGHERWGAHLISTDGIGGWQPWSPPAAYDHTIRWTDGTEFHPVRRERPWFLIENGKITHLFTAVYDGQRTWNQPVPLMPPVGLTPSPAQPWRPLRDDGVYQNGGYWATPLPWLMEVLMRADPGRAAAAFWHAVDDFQTRKDINEWVNDNAPKKRGVRDYCASAALPLVGAKRLRAALAATGRQLQPDLTKYFDASEKWLREQAPRVLRGSSRPGKDGVRIFTPDATGGYGAFWVRDWSYMIEGCPEAFTREEIRDGYLFLAAAQRADGCMPDRVRADGKGVFSPGGEAKPLSQHGSVDQSPFMVILCHQYWKLHGDLDPFRCTANALEKAMRFTPRNPANGLVTITDATLFRPYSFLDTVPLVGDQQFDSVLFWDACVKLAEMLEAGGQSARAAKWRQEAERVKTGMASLWDDQLGLFVAASENWRQPAIWGSLFAVYSGLTTPEQSDRITRWCLDNYHLFVFRGQVRHLPKGTFWGRPVPETVPFSSR